jgi:hypothetical protein
MNTLYVTLGFASLFPVGIVAVFAIGSLIGLAGVIGLNRLSRVASALAIIAGVALAGYGIAETATHLAQAPTAAMASVTPVAGSGPQGFAPPASPAAVEPPLALPMSDHVASPRECAADRGITESCTFE